MVPRLTKLVITASVDVTFAIETVCRPKEADTLFVIDSWREERSFITTVSLVVSIATEFVSPSKDICFS